MMKKKISLFLGVVEELIFSTFSNFNKKYKKIYSVERFHLKIYYFDM